MKIMVIGPEYFNYTSSITWALQQLGHQTVEVPCKSFKEGCNYIEKKINKMGILRLEERYYEQWNENVRSLFYEFNPDVCIIIGLCIAFNGNFISEQTLKILKDNNSKLILWLLDSIVRMPESEKNLHFYDKIVSFEHRDIQYLYEKFRIECFYLPVGYDSRIYYPDESVFKEFDICFIGSPVAERTKILKAVATYAHTNNKKFIVFTKFWDEKHFWKKYSFAKKNNPLQLFIENKNISPQEVAQIYLRSKICLNIHVPAHESVNPRTFEIMGTKSFQLVDKKPKMNELVRVGKDLVEYNDIDDLINKIDYYLDNEDLRKKIASNGYEYVKEHYMIKEVIVKLLS